MIKISRSIVGRNEKFILFAIVFTLLCALRSSAETPDHYIRRFAEFDFAFHAKVQEPEIFLSTKSGDCDDFATVAADELGRDGYETQLFAVRMKNETHVVCYVPAVQAYLDYNNRSKSNPLVRTDGTLGDIASKVAQSFSRDWVSAYQFSYHDKMKWLVDHVVVNSPTEKTMLASATVEQAAGNRNRSKLFSFR